MNSNDEIVRRFCEAFARMDADELIGYFADDAVYHNIPMQPLHGRAAIHRNFEQLRSKFGAVAFEIKHQVTAGRVVMNERIDYLTLGERRVALPVAGIFELDAGKITAWRDYFDLTLLRPPA
ncbi:MAG: limonene-1,2-epoxide hydrolase family protein [Janthinobacterium lividum]